MSRAKDDMMDMLHLITAEQLIDIIKNGIQVVDKDGEIVRVPAPAAYLANAIKFLKDNGITAEPNAGRFAGAQGALDGVPTFDEDEAFDQQYAN